MKRPRFQRPVCACALAVWAASLLACAGGGRSSPTAAPATPAPTKAAEASGPPQLSDAEVQRRTAAWRAALEQRADELAEQADAAEAKLAEREATKNRRDAQGLIDGTIRDEIEKLKRDVPRLWAELAKVEDEIAAGPPASLFAVEPPGATEPPRAAAPPRPPAPAPVPVYAPGAGGKKKVHVSGYTRADGTYVKPHTRSSPKR